jgi:CheY-like chemotaxis protein/anti-sigma regulatory factor (Ser/Thr protein kinase)
MPTPKTILLVGADATVEQLLQTAAKGMSLQIETARDNSTCLERVKEQSFDLVITDIHTQGMDDLELLRRLRWLRPEIKVIVLAPQSTTEDVIEALREHAFGYFSQPLDASTFVQLVTQALQVKNWTDGIELLSARPEWIALRVRCRRMTADRLMQFMRELRMDLPAEERENLGIAFREMLMNALEHGAGFDQHKTVEICAVRTPRVILYQIRDPGEGFSMDDLPHAAAANPPDDPIAHLAYRTEHGMRAGGFGMMIVRDLVDELYYNEKGNEVLLIKHLDTDQSKS